MCRCIHRVAILGHEYINEVLKPFAWQSKIALKQTLILKLGVTLVLTVTQVYVFVNLRRVTDVPPKVARYPVFSRSTNLESKLIEFFVFANFSRTVRFGSLQSFAVRKIGDFPHFLPTLASNNAFIGASMSEPHISVTALRMCVCMLACLLAAIYRKF